MLLERCKEVSLEAPRKVKVSETGRMLWRQMMSVMAIVEESFSDFSFGGAERTVWNGGEEMAEKSGNSWVCPKDCGRY